jgi:hypothetical protein
MPGTTLPINQKIEHSVTDIRRECWGNGDTGPVVALEDGGPVGR